MSSPFVVFPPGGGGDYPPPPPVSGDKTYTWIVAWILVIALLALADKTAIGHLIIYLALVLVLVLLLVTQYQFVAQALAPIGQKAPSNG